jgi:pilus assembly protein CpaE
VIIDADLQYGDVTAFLNLQNRFSIADLAAQAENLDEDLLREMLTAYESGLQVLPAPKRPIYAEEVKEAHLKKTIELLRVLFAYIVIDTDSYLDDITLAALDTADLIILTLTPEIPSIKNTRWTLDTFNQLGIEPERILLVLNQLDKRDNIRSEQIGEKFKYEVAAEVPYDRQSARAAINRGVPILADQKTHPLARPLLEVAGAVKERLLQEVEVE